jgi:hypothetical protein
MTTETTTAPPTAEELGRAWDAVRAGRFRHDNGSPRSSSRNNDRANSDLRLTAAATISLPGPVVTVVGAQWGLIGAAVTEHGHDGRVTGSAVEACVLDRVRRGT